jgi:hypothetical protein
MRAAAFLLLFAGLTSPALAGDEAPAPAPSADAGISLSDYQAAFRQRLMAADADHDGRLSQSELAAARAATGREGGRRDPSRMFRMLDVNGDGFLDASELDAMSARRFARMDANGDGKLTAEEREASRAQWRGRMGDGGSGGGRGWGQDGGAGGWGSGAGADQSGGSEQSDD